MKLNNKGMSIVEVVLTFAIIMLITTGLLIIVVNYRNKVSVSVERLTMDTFKNNITQDLYRDILEHGLTEINEYNDTNLKNLEEEVKLELKNLYQSENSLGVFINDSDFDKYFYGIHTETTNIDGAINIVENDLNNYQVKDYNKASDTDYKNIFAHAIIEKAKLKYGDPNTGNSCLILSDLHRCINIVLNDGTNKVFGTSKIIESAGDNSVIRNSLENKYLYYDGIKYKIKDTIPKYVPKDKDGNSRKLSDLQRIQVIDDNILGFDFTVLEDGTKLYVYKINVDIYHIDFREDFGIHMVVSTDDVSM